MATTVTVKEYKKIICDQPECGTAVCDVFEPPNVQFSMFHFVCCRCNKDFCKDHIVIIRTYDPRTMMSCFDCCDEKYPGLRSDIETLGAIPE